jgi:hypothetical protein
MVDKGLKLTLRHSKTDQEGEGQVIAVPSGKTLKPVERLKAWLAVRGGGAGPLFYQIDPAGRLTDKPMSDRSIARLIQKYAGRGARSRERGGPFAAGRVPHRGVARRGDHRQDAGGVAAQEGRSAAGLCSVS